MTIRTRLFLPALLAATLTAGTPATVNLQPGSQLVFRSLMGSGALAVDGTHISVLAPATVLVTPDPLGVAKARSWSLVPGTELDLALPAGSRLVGSASASAITFNLTAATISPDPGSGTTYPPSATTINPDPGAGDVPPSITTTGMSTTINPDPGAGDVPPSLTTTSSTSVLTIDPDPGDGQRVPPS